MLAKMEKELKILSSKVVMIISGKSSETVSVIT